MNWNAILGIIGLSLLAFVAAFAVGRLHRPAAPVFTTQATPGAISTSPDEAQAQLVAYPSELPALEPAPNSLDSTVDPDPEFDEELAAIPRVASAPAAPSRVETTAKKRKAENRKAVAARRAHADQLPDDFKKYYTQELPADAISSEQNVRVNVAGEQADVITLSSRAFNAENKSFVLQQVRSELEALGFKRVNITNGRGFNTSVGL